MSAKRSKADIEALTFRDCQRLALGGHRQISRGVGEDRKRPEARMSFFEDQWAGHWKKYIAKFSGRITVASKVTLLAVVVALTIDTRTANWRIDNARSYRPTKPPADHSRCGAPGSRAHIRVLARRRAGMDPAATRGLRTGRDPALPAVHLGHWPCQVVHVPLPSLP